MEFIYVLVKDGGEWEDMILFLTEAEAIQTSIKYSKDRVEIFSKKDVGYVPTYKYYSNGVICHI